MARSSGGSGELILVATAVVVVVVIFIVPYALALLLYSLPLLVLWLLTPTEVGAEPQLIVDTSPHPLLAKLRAQMRFADEQYDLVRYTDWGVRWSDNLDRFEERSHRGRDLNRQLEEWTIASRHLSAEIREVEEPETKAFGAWSTELSDWYQQHAVNAAKQTGWKLTLQVFVGVWVVAELVGASYPDFINLFAFAWNPAPAFLHPGLGIGAAAAWAAGIYRVFRPPAHFAERAQEKIDEYLNARRIREEAEDRQTTYSSEESFEEASDEDDEVAPSASAWHEILKVDPQSPIDEIKAAYKKAAIACHPDKVAHMNEHIQQVAKEEMQKLNDAFQQAQLARGF
ncbi:DnaJ domain-containing protein [Bradyrhizobium japonicum]|uniref:DnaJ domain-containing protein n=1 Tax=Bradyrhizobium japonicum TaxID=375 RepID=UPI001BAD6594|nr:DnaJ domain-containing protein [Bradyrhizobium japonicum]MBR0765230.1 DnaJ domain-containing protein [Bradyrhizobium japonicum]